MPDEVVAGDLPAGAVPKRRWHALDSDRALRTLDTDPDGLSDQEAADRLVRYGANEIRVGEEDPWWRLVLRQLRDPLIYILLVAAAVSVAVQHPIDAVVMVAVGATVILGGELDKWWNRRRRRPLG